MQFVGLKCSDFINSVEEAYKNSAYIYYNKKSGEIKAFTQEAFENLKKDFEKLSFSTIIKISYKFNKKNKFNYENACMLSQALHVMRTNKKEKQKKEWYLFKKIDQYLDCFKNHLDGFGMHSSRDICKNLIFELENIADIPEIVISEFYNNVEIPDSNDKQAIKQQDLAPRNPLPKSYSTCTLSAPKRTIRAQTSLADLPSNNTCTAEMLEKQAPTDSKKSYSTRAISRGRSLEMFEKVLERTNSQIIQNSQSYFAKPQNKKTKLQQFIEDPQGCNELTLIALFANISVDVPLSYQPNATCQHPDNFLDLFATLGKSEIIDLKNEKIMESLLHLFWYKSKIEHVKIIKWIKKQLTFHAKLADDIFNLLHRKFDANQPIDHNDVYQLFKVYREKIEQGEWADDSFPHSKGLIEAIILMVKIDWQSANTTNCINWYCSQKTFHLASFKELMKFCMSLKKPLDLVWAKNLAERFLMVPNCWNLLEGEQNLPLVSYIQALRDQQK